jgi:hypothetical protein
MTPRASGVLEAQNSPVAADTISNRYESPAFSQALAAIWPISGLRFFVPQLRCKYLMSPELQRGKFRTIEHANRSFPRPTMTNADQLRRFNRVARREPTALVGVLEFWLGPDMAEGETRGDC